ncbi:DUF484 family protein [Sphingomonas sabuli]|uniref:DUF484 family protein n=1 Tax=Sphingomonas sabuli TaxID=2764186 RepID=A0A7G9L4S8_9SPHN|nr:DUF484 family protein [Sphingomonas sabuli]QNM83627.1 DUF484 family protein [Sphingomonas sabuli]
MGQVVQFEQQAVATLRARLGAAEEANEDLIAFARGHSDAVASINAAVLEAIEADSLEDLLDIIANRWPDILGIDLVAIALMVGGQAFRADQNAIERVEAAFVGRMLAHCPRVEIRSVNSGHALFGAPAAASVRAEALIRIDGAPSYPTGLIVLGQREALSIASSHGSELLLFLGKVVAATVRRCVTNR